MRRALFLATLTLALPWSAAAARADWSLGFSFGARGVHVQGRYESARPCPHCVRACAVVPVYREVWVPPVYERVVRWTPYGPVSRTVLVRPGYYRTVFVGYRCARSGLCFR